MTYDDDRDGLHDGNLALLGKLVLISATWALTAYVTAASVGLLGWLK